MIISSQAVGKPPDDPDLRVRLRKDLRVTNPDYVAQVRFGNKFAPKPPQYLYGYSYDEGTDTITIPRDYYIQNLYRPEDKIKTVSVQGKYPEPRMEMFDYQEEASDAFFALVNQNDEKGLPTDATVVMATSSGKSFLGMFCAYHSNERCLVVVPTQEIEAAWIEDCCKVFKMSPRDIGRIRATKFSIGDAFTIGSIQTLMNRDPKTWAPHFGITVFDEVHRCPAQRFLEVAENCRSHLRLGLTATDIRRDGMMPAIRWHLGQNVYKDTTPKNSVPLVYHAISTDISVTPTRIFQGEVEYEWNDVLSKICADMDYATLIMQIYEKTQLIGGAVLITTCRKDHIEVLTQRFRYRYGKAWAEENIAIVTGQTKKRRELLQEIKDGKWKITIAVQSIMSEGASVPKWRHVIVGTPFNDPKTAIQIKGRPIRKDPSDPTKTDGHMWDIAVNIQMCRNMARNRARALASHTSVTKVYRHAPGTDIILQRES